MAEQAPVIAWFRQDLRLADNPALAAAAKTGAPIVPVYILDDAHAGDWKMGAASRWWLHRSLEALDESLGGKLSCFAGPADEILPRLASELRATQVFWNRCYEPWRIRRDRRLMQSLRDSGVAVESLNGSLLFEPQSVTKSDGTPYRVFTPYYRKGCLEGQGPPRQPLPAPDRLDLLRAEAAESIEDLGLLPAIRWYDDIERAWTPGEAGAGRRLEDFLANGIGQYKEGRNRPDRESVSRLSPHLHFGEISPHRVWHAVGADAADGDVDAFHSELGWREFSHYLLYHFPELPRDNLQPRFDAFPWRSDDGMLECWQRGETGFPIVDAGMRELWRTGFMHNRVRMITASFLVKNLLLHWHHGEDWFWDCLVDADLANNSASWQWVAGCGADAAPYFRIFNPVLQGNKFDPDGTYVRRYLPELSDLPAKHIHDPAAAPEEVLEEAGVVLGENYPRPIVDLKESRERALAAYKRSGG